MSILTLTSYRKKGINAYLLMVGTDINAADYGTPFGPEDVLRSHQSKSHTVKIDLISKADGLYIYKEANGHKTRYGWLKIEAGEIVEEFDKEPLLPTLDLVADPLPALEGTSKQIAWAESIRAKFIEQIGNQITDWSRKGNAWDCLDSIILAKQWIGNRDNLKPQKFINRVKALDARDLEVDAELSLQDAIDAETNETRVVIDDEDCIEADIYAIIHIDRIEVISNSPGNSGRIPKEGRRYIGSIEKICWEYPLESLNEILKCPAIDFALDSSGNKVAMKNRN